MVLTIVYNGIIVEEYSTLIKPDYPVDGFISSLTGITNEMLETEPKVTEVIDDIKSFIGEDIILGHTVNFDLNFIYDKLLELNTI